VASTKDERYKWIETILIKFHYVRLKKQQKGVIVHFICKITNYSRQQVTRLIEQYVTHGKIVRRQNTVNGFKKKYSAVDIVLLAKMDERHNQPNGAAVKKLCERMYCVYGDEHYKNLAGISVSHLYNLRQSITYSRQRRHYEKTKYKSSTIGERRKPQSHGEPGYIRIDTVHQGDLDGNKGVYHINATDEVTQFEIVISVSKISERYLIPVLKKIIKAFPFKIQGFHSDNGSEYINKVVEKLLKKLLIEFTKSRPRHSNDNALAESKNGSVVRKIFGYSHIKQKWADKINEFNVNHLNPYLNYHRPCFFSVTEVSKKGKQVKKYPYQQMKTPYEKFKSLENAKQYLKDGVTFDDLDKIALAITDNEAADQLNEERKKLFKIIIEQDRACA